MKNLIKSVTKIFSKRSAEILIGVGIAGGITTTVLAVNATPKALQLIEEERKNRIRNATVAEARKWSEEGGVKFTPMEYVKLCWKPFLPVVITGALSISCIICADSIHKKRNAALASLCQLSTTAFTEYKDKVVETIGIEQEKAIREEVAKEKVNKSLSNGTQILITGNGKSLFYEPLSDRYFESDLETIRKIVNDLNWKMSYGSEMYISLSELYDELGLKHTRISDSIGWKISDGNIDLDITTTQLSDDGRPCIVLDFLKAPTYDFDKYF